MSASINSLGDILKIQYEGPIREELNQEVLALEMWEKGSADWSGLNVTIPIHISRNASVHKGSLSGNLGGIGNQGYAQLVTTAKYVYGEFSISRPLMKSAKGAGKSAFLNAVESEMMGLKKDVRNMANRVTIYGGLTKGFIHQKKVSSSTTANCTVAAPGAGEDWFEYSGAYDYFRNVVNATSGTWVRVRLRDMGTYEEIVPTSAGAGPYGIFVSDIDESGQRIKLAVVSNDGAANPASFTTVIAELDRAIAVQLHTEQFLDSSGGGGANFGCLANKTFFDLGTVSDYALNANNEVVEPTGIFDNLCTEVHFGLDRSDSPGPGTPSGATQLQARILTMATGTGAGSNRIPLTPDRMQELLDEVMIDSNEEPDMILASPLFRSKYIALLNKTFQTNPTGPKSGGNAGFDPSSLNFAGIPIRVTKDSPRGLAMFLKNESWKMYELSPFEFVDEDGSVFDRQQATGADGFVGYSAWYWDALCDVPHCNAILTGFEG